MARREERWGGREGAGRGGGGGGGGVAEEVVGERSQGGPERTGAPPEHVIHLAALCSDLVDGELGMTVVVGI